MTLSGYRLDEPAAVARVDLLRTLRRLEVPVATTRRHGAAAWEWAIAALEA